MSFLKKLKAEVLAIFATSSSKTDTLIGDIQQRVQLLKEHSILEYTRHLDLRDDAQELLDASTLAREESDRALRIASKIGKLIE